MNNETPNLSPASRVVYKETLDEMYRIANSIGFIASVPGAGEILTESEWMQQAVSTANNLNRILSERKRLCKQVYELRAQVNDKDLQNHILLFKEYNKMIADVMGLHL